MTEYVPKTSFCKNCKRKLADTREILQGADGTWVHTFKNGEHYPVKCSLWDDWVAEPMEE